MDRTPLYVRYRKLFILAPIVLCLMMLIPLKKASINTDLMAYLPENFEERMNLEKLEEEFGKFEPIILLIESKDILDSSTLLRINNISSGLENHPEFDQVVSLFSTKYIHGIEGAMIVDPVIKSIPINKLDRQTLKNEIIDNPLVNKILVSEDFRYSLIIVNPEKGFSDEKLIGIIQNLLDQNPGEEKIYLNGLPYMREQIQKLAIRDLGLLMPLGLVLMIIILYFSFKEFRGVALPFSVVVLSIFLAMGLMPLLGWEYSIIAVLVPIMMIAIANNYGVHLVMRSQELRSVYPAWCTQKIVSESVARLRYPILMTGLTTIAGVLGMVVHIMLPARQMGIVSAIGVGFALLASLLFIPAILSGLKPGKIIKSFNNEKKGFLEQLLKFTGNLVAHRSKFVIAIFTFIILLSGLGIKNLKVAIHMENMMPLNHPIRFSTSLANENLGGTKTLSVLFEGDILSPEIMQAMDWMEQELEKMPETGSVTSIASVTRIISRALNDPGDPFYDTIPNNREAIAQYIEFYNMSGDPEDFEKLVNFEYSKAILNIQFKIHDISEFNKYENRVRELVKGIPWCTLMAGQCLVEKGMSEAIVQGQIYSLIFAFAAIVLMLWFIFRSLMAGLYGSIALLASLICNFGMMGWLGLELDIATSLLSSVAIGIGVDYTIHFFWRLKYELSLQKVYAEATVHALSTTGRGITINALSVMTGFAILFFSGLVIMKTFAMLIIISLLVCLICALVYVPAICLLSRPAFLEIKNHYHSKII